MSTHGESFARKYREIIDFFEFQIIETRKIDDIKIELAQLPYFELFSCFSRLDQKAKGYIQADDFKQFIQY